MEGLKVLQKVDIFNSLDESELNEVLSVSARESFPEGDTIFKEGAQGDKFYVILSGAVRISKNVQGIGEEALAVLKPGDYFGEMALVDDSPRSADAITHEESTMLIISKNNLHILMESNKDIAYKLLWKFVRTLSGRLRDTNEKIKSFFAMTGGF